MNWKKLLLIAIAVIGFGFAAAPRAEAGLSVGIGIGAPIGYYGGGYYGGGYPYGYGDYGRPYGYYAPVHVAVRRHYHWRHGHRYVCTRLHRHYY